jgi:hypothetical protein
MKKILLLTALLALFCACQDKYEDLKSQVAKLETRMDQLSKVLDDAIAKSMTVTVTEVEGGHKLTFSDGSSFVVADGEKGDPGDPGEPGDDATVDIQETDDAYVIKVGDRTYTIPKTTKFTLILDKEEAYVFGGQSVTVKYTLIGADASTKVFVSATEGIKADIDQEAKQIVITLPETLASGDYAVVTAVSNESGLSSSKYIIFTIPDGFAGKGLMGLYATAVGGSGKYYTTKPFPYARGANIQVHIPGATPEMLQNITMFPTLDAGNTIDPALPKDFTSPFDLTLHDGLGNYYTHNLSIDTRVATVTKEWETDATAMNLAWFNRMRLAVDDNYVYVLDAVINYCEGIRVLDRNTGAFVKTMAAPYPNGYVSLGDINVDDAGNLIVSRYNYAYGCGLLAFYYDESVADPWVCCVYYADETTPASLGERVTVCGDVRTKAILYATAPNLNKIYSWNIANGTSSYPAVEDYSGISGTWNNAIVRRPSMEGDSPVYLGITMGTESSGFADASALFQEKGTSNEITSANLFARILNYKTFTMNNEEYLAAVFQESWERYSASYLRIFNITDRDRWTMVGGADRYNEDFRIYQYDGLGGINYDQSGGIDIVQDDSATYIYVGSPAKGSGDSVADAANTKVTCFKMVFE